MPHFASIDVLLAALARPDARLEHLGPWCLIDQERITAFAEATDDRQWIHLDAGRAARGPFGSTVAHGFLTLSLVPHLTADAVVIDGIQVRLNYGLDRVRFTNPVSVGSRVRAHTVIADAEPARDGVKISLDVTVELEGQSRPALVARQLLLVVS